MIPVRTAAVIGLGLIGGSIARDLGASGVRILGTDRDPAMVDAALQEGVLAAPLGPDGHELGQAEAVFLAVPVIEAAPVLRRIAPSCGAARVVMSVGSTQRSIIEVAETTALRDRFVGTHPLAGDHRSGWSASRPGLFRGARLFLVRAASTSDLAVHVATEIWSGLGALPEMMTPGEHDRLVAVASHMPHVAASAAALAMAGSGLSRSDLGAGGLAMTRLAGSSPEVWTSICLENADLVREALANLRDELERATSAVRRRDAQELSQFFTDARVWFDAG